MKPIKINNLEPSVVDNLTILQLKNYHINFTPEIIFDVGANVGSFTISFSQLFPDTKVYAFEPVKHTFKLLSKNVENLSNVIPTNIGLSNKNKSNIPIGLPSIPDGVEHNFGRSTIHKYEGKPIDYIDLYKFSEVCKLNNITPDIVKLDVEGCEYEILKEAEESGILDKIKLIYIELNKEYKEYTNKCIKLLSKYFHIVNWTDFNEGNEGPLNFIFKNKNLKPTDSDLNSGYNFIKQVNEWPLLKNVKNNLSVWIEDKYIIKK